MAELGNQGEIQALWQDALAEYRRETNRDLSLEQLEALDRVDSLDKLAARIESSGASFAAFRAENQRLWSALKAFTAPLTFVAQVSAAAIPDPFGIPSSTVLDAILYLLRACDRVSSAYDWIEQVFQELQEFSDRLSQYIDTPSIDPKLHRKIVAILAAVLQILGHSEKLIRERRFRQYLKVTFLGRDDVTRQIFDKLNKLMDNEQRYVVGVTYAATQRIEGNVRALKDKANNTNENVEKVLALVKQTQDSLKTSSIDDDTKLRLTLYSTLAWEAVKEAFVRNLSALLNGTGTWLQDEPLFDSWMRRDAAILWIFGGPGAGKSFLSTAIIQQLLEAEETNDEGTLDTVAYFFVNENNENLRDANTILKTLAWQIAMKNPGFKNHAIRVCRERSLTLLAELTWKNLFLDYYVSGERNGNTATIVIDGLDEATSEARLTILSLMKELVFSQGDASCPPIRFAIIGRTSLKGDMNFKRFEKVHFRFIEVSSLKTRRDIDGYIKKRLGELEILHEIRKIKPDGLKKANKIGGRIMKKISERADGVFLWAKLLLDSLEHKDLSQIDTILSNPPPSLDDMIQSVFHRLGKDDQLDQEVLKKMLLFITYSRRPLLFGELAIITSLPSKRPNYLLWNHTIGKLSSVFDLKFPKGFDPDDEGEYGVSTMAGEGTQAHNPLDDEQEQPFNFSCDDDNDTVAGSKTSDESGAVSDDDDDDIFPPTIDRTRSTKTPSDDRSESGESDWLAEGHEAEDDISEFLSQMSPEKLKTQVSFCHTRIRDYLIREGNTNTNRKLQLWVIPDVEKAQADITITCLEMFRLEISLTEKRDLCDYPLCHLPFHLEAVDKTKVAKEQAVEIIKHLYWLFGTARGTRCLLNSMSDYDEFHGSHNTFWALWIVNDEFFKLVQSWFGHVESIRDDIRASCDDTAITWMLSAAKTKQDFLRPMIVESSKMWLARESWEASDQSNKGEFHAWVNHGLLAQVEDSPLSQDLQDLDWPNQSSALWRLAPERIEHIAEWAGLEQDVHWHTRVGWILMDGQYYDAAVAHFRRAVALYEKAWVALEGLARCAGEQSQFQEAISWMEKAVDAVPKTEETAGIAGFLLPRISQWKSILGQDNNAFDVARESFTLAPTNMQAADTYLKELSRKEMYADLISILQYMANTRAEQGDYTLLVRFLIHGYAFYYWGPACARYGRPQFVTDSLDEAINTFKNGERAEYVLMWLLPNCVCTREADKCFRNHSWLLYVGGYFKYHYYGLEQQAMEDWESFLNLRAQMSEHSQEELRVEKLVRSQLAQLYFDDATTKWRQNPGIRTDSTEKLKNLASEVFTRDDEEFEGFDVFRSDYPAMLWYVLRSP